MTNYLSIQNLRKVYHDNGKKFVALDDVSLILKKVKLLPYWAPTVLVKLLLSLL